MGHTGLIQKISSHRTVITAATLTVLLLASIVSTLVSADTLNTRSITPSSASVTAAPESVQYTVAFTPEEEAGAFVIEFCSNTPLLGQSCTAPTGFDASAAETSTAGVVITAATANKIVATMEIDPQEDEHVIEFTKLTNPTQTGVMYARIVTYDDGTDAAGYQSENPSAVGNVLDSGSVALYFNDSVSVSGTVLETLEFCVSKEDIAANCSNVVAPVLQLGEEVAEGIIALQPGVVSTGSLFTQINTNAVSGAVVHLKSSALCGGLMRAGTDQCDIVAAQDNDVTTSTAAFGVKTAAAPTNADGAVNPIGTLRPYDPSVDPEEPEAYYGPLKFAFKYDDTHASGVTSTFGDLFLDTNGAPATGKNLELEFGASVTNSTPAGLYSTDLSMIAVGKF